MLNVDTLKKNYQMIHFFGLGFVQLKINPNLRYHFYHPSLTSIVGEEEVHNHRYNFTSNILAGSLEEELYQFISDAIGNYVMVYESCEKNIEPPPLKEFGDLILLKKVIHEKEDTYKRNKNDFHRVKTDFCITELTRENKKDPFAKVIRLKEAEKVCPFSKQLSEDECWNIVSDCIALSKYH